MKDYIIYARLESQLSSQVTFPHSYLLKNDSNFNFQMSHSIRYHSWLDRGISGKFETYAVIKFILRRWNSYAGPGPDPKRFIAELLWIRLLFEVFDLKFTFWKFLALQNPE